MSLPNGHLLPNAVFKSNDDGERRTPLYISLRITFRIGEKSKNRSFDLVQYSNRLELRPNHDLLLDIVRRQSKIYFSISVQRVGLRLGLQVQFGLR